MTKTIWFDVTTLLNWFRPAVGIIRMELECARYLLHEFEGSAKFCRFKHGRGAYCEVHRGEIESAIERLDRSIYGKKDSFRSTIKILENEIKKLVQRRIEHFSPLNQEKIKNFLRNIRDKAYTLVPKLNSIWFYRPHRREIQFLSGDVYITLGADWWSEYKDLHRLYTLKGKTGIKVLGLCYDIIPIKFPHLCLEQVAQIFSRYIVDLCWCADRILCISENTKKDLSKFVESMNVRFPRLEVVHLGSEIKAKTGTIDGAIQEICRRPFILYVSTIERRKNHEVLYRAYTRLVEAGRRDLPHLVFVGMTGWGISDIFAALRFDPRTKGLIVQLNQVNDAELDLLYRHALFTVFPSLYEGWGLPVSESLAYGKFCIASNTSSLPEVGGNLVEYLDPWDLPAWVERLAYYFDNPKELKKKEKKIASDYIPISWADTARVLISHAQDL